MSSSLLVLEPMTVEEMRDRLGAMWPTVREAMMPVPLPCVDGKTRVWLEVYAGQRSFWRDDVQPELGDVLDMDGADEGDERMPVGWFVDDDEAP